MKPMLAAATDGLNLIYPLLASPKLDGVRCVVVDGVALSRSLKPIPNQHVQRLFGQARLNGLDGELAIGPINAADVYQRTVSGVMRHEGEPPVSLMIFDDYLAKGDFNHRVMSTERRAKKLGLDFLQHIFIRAEDELLAFEQACLGDGFEGIMIRSLAGPYKPGRSTLKEGWLLKLKRFIDSEAEILGCEPAKHNTNEATKDKLGHTERSSKQAGMVLKDELGALKVRDVKTKVEFDIGTGFDAQQRRELWADRAQLVGRLVKYKYQPVGVKDKPRFPVFLGFRDRRDL
jgi:DNA ligase-1